MCLIGVSRVIDLCTDWETNLLCWGSPPPKQWWSRRSPSRWSAAGRCHLVWTAACPEPAVYSGSPRSPWKNHTHVQPCCLTLMTVLMKPSRNVTHHSNEPSGVSSSARWLHQTTARRWSSYLVNSPTQHTIDQINEWYLAGLFWCWHLPAVSLA